MIPNLCHGMTNCTRKSKFTRKIGPKLKTCLYLANVERKRKLKYADAMRLFTFSLLSTQ